MQLRIFRQPTKDIQPSGEYHIDTLQYQNIYVNQSQTNSGISGISTSKATYSDWIDVVIVEADSY